MSYMHLGLGFAAVERLGGIKEAEKPPEGVWAVPWHQQHQTPGDARMGH